MTEAERQQHERKVVREGIATDFLHAAKVMSQLFDRPGERLEERQKIVSLIETIERKAFQEAAQIASTTEYGPSTPVLSKEEQLMRHMIARTLSARANEVST